MSTMFLKSALKPTWEDLRNPESEFHDMNPFKVEGEVPFISVSDEDKERMRKFDVTFFAHTHNGNLICEFNIYQLSKQIQWEEALHAKAGDEILVYLVNGEFVVCPYVDSDGVVYRLAR